MITEPHVFFQQVMALLMMKSPKLAALMINQDSENELAELLTDRIAALIEDKPPDDITDAEEIVHQFEGQDEYEMLANRNSMLASALGACDCWGENKDCPVCQGCGQPGWTLPERKPFAYYVHPALRMVSEWRRTARPQTER